MKPKIIADAKREVAVAIIQELDRRNIPHNPKEDSLEKFIREFTYDILTKYPTEKYGEINYGEREDENI